MTVDYTQPPQAPPAPQQPVEKKKTGCLKIFLIGCAVVIALGIAFVAVLVFFVFGVIRSTEVYKQALRRTQSNPEVIARLGQPIESGWWVSGSVTVNKESGSAQFKFPVQGPKDKAIVRVEATHDGKQWLFSELKVKPDHSAEIDLLNAP